MTRHKRFLPMLGRLLGGILIGLLLSACNGDGGLNLTDGGIDGTGTGISVGPITGFGSVIVNEVAYDTRAARVFINDQAADPTRLRLGMYVTVKSSQDAAAPQGEADYIEYRDTLRGPVEFIGGGGDTLRILGHSVKISEQTHLLGLDQLADLEPGDMVRVSAPSGHHVLPATLVEYLPGADPLRDNRVVGSLAILDEAGKNFYIAGMRIFYDSALTLPARLYPGQPLAISGERQRDRNGELMNQLTARHVRALTPDALAVGSVARIRGTVTRFNHLTDFDVQYRTVCLSPELIAGFEENALNEGDQVSLHGITDERGVIQVQELNILDQASRNREPATQPFRLSGPVTEILPEQHQFKVSDIKVSFDENTLFRDLSAQFPDYNAENLGMGQYVTVAGGPDERATLYAVAVHYEPFVSFQEKRQFQGRASGVEKTHRRLKVLGHPVVAGPETRYYDAANLENFVLPPPGPPLNVPEHLETDAAGFFARLAEHPNHLVNVFGSPLGEDLLADTLILLPIEMKR